MLAAAPGCIQVAGLEEVEPLPDGGVADAATAPVEIAYLKPQTPGAGDGFGEAVAMVGDQLVVGAPFEDSAATGVGGDRADDSVQNCGAVYVLSARNGAAVEEAYLKPHHSALDLHFGRAVAASGDTLVIGAPGDSSSVPGINADPTDGGAKQSGAVHVFVRDGQSWTHQAYIKASNPDLNDVFGSTVAIDGDTLVVGAPGESGLDGPSDNLAPAAGAVYVFVRTAGGVWSQQAYIKAPIPDRGDQFGRSLAIDGDDLVVGAPAAEATEGEAHLFSRDGASWGLRASFRAPSRQEGAGFGRSVAIDGGLVAIAAPFTEVESADGLVEQAGVVHLFAIEGGTVQQLTSEARENAVLGFEVAMSGDWIAVTKLFEHQGVSLFRRQGDSFGLEHEIRSRYTEPEDRFGTGIALDAGRLLVGARGESSAFADRPTDNTADQAGAAYLFEL